MNKNLIFLFCALAMVLSVQSCDNDDHTKDVEFKDLTIAQVQQTIQGKWRYTKVTTGILGSKSEFTLELSCTHDLIFEDDKMMIVSTDPSCNTLPAHWETITWKKEKTELGELFAYYTESAEEEANYVVGIRNGFLVCIERTSDDTMINRYYSRVP